MHGLTRLIVTTAAVANQAAGGYFNPGPSLDAFVGAVLSNPGGVNLGNLPFFNMPFCDYSLNPALDSTQTSYCDGFSTPSLCEFYIQMNNEFGCPAQKVSGQAWPYPQGEGSIIP